MALSLSGLSPTDSEAAQALLLHRLEAVAAALAKARRLLAEKFQVAFAARFCEISFVEPDSVWHFDIVRPGRCRRGEKVSGARRRADFFLHPIEYDQLSFNPKNGYLSMRLQRPSALATDIYLGVFSRLLFNAADYWQRVTPYVPDMARGTREQLLQMINKWEFAENEERNLDYTVSLKVLTPHPEFRVGDPEILKCDVLYFIPYIELGSAYILTWCRQTNEMGDLTVTDRAISFPVAGTSEMRTGALVSPLLVAKATSDTINLVGNFGNAHMKFQLRYKIYDASGQSWVLSWKKIDDISDFLNNVPS